MDKVESYTCYLMDTRLNVNTYFDGRIYRETYGELLDLIPKIAIQDDPIYYIIYKITIKIKNNPPDNIDYNEMMEYINEKNYNRLSKYIDLKLDEYDDDDDDDDDDKLKFYDIDQVLNTDYNKIIIIGIKGKFCEININNVINLSGDSNIKFLRLLITGTDMDEYDDQSNPYKDLYDSPDDFYNEKIEEAKAAIAIQILKEKAIELLKTITNYHAANCDAEKKTIEEKDAEIERLNEQLNQKPTSTDNKDNNLILSFNNNNSTDTQTSCDHTEKDEQIKKLEQEIIQLKLQELKNVAIRALQKLLPDNNNTTEEEKKICDEEVHAKIEEVVKQKDEEMKKALLSVIEGGDNATADATDALIKKLDNNTVNRVIDICKNEKLFNGVSSDSNDKVDVIIPGISNLTISFNNSNIDESVSPFDHEQIIQKISDIIINVIDNAENTYQRIKTLTTRINDDKNNLISVDKENLISNDKQNADILIGNLDSILKDKNNNDDGTNNEDNKLTRIINIAKEIETCSNSMDKKLTEYNNSHNTELINKFIKMLNNSQSLKTDNKDDVLNMLKQLKDENNKLEVLNNQLTDKQNEITVLTNQLTTSKNNIEGKDRQINVLTDNMNTIFLEKDKVLNENLKKLDSILNKNIVESLNVVKNIKNNLNIVFERSYMEKENYIKYAEHKNERYGILYNVPTPAIQPKTDIGTIVETCNNSVIHFLTGNFRYFLAFPLNYTVKNKGGEDMLTTIGMWMKIFPKDKINITVHLLQFLFVDTYFEFWEKLNDYKNIYFNNFIEEYCKNYDINIVNKDYFNSFIQMLNRNQSNNKIEYEFRYDQLIIGNNVNVKYPIMHICDVIEMYNYYKYEYNEDDKDHILHTIQVFLFNYYIKSVNNENNNNNKNYWLDKYCGIETILSKENNNNKSDISDEIIIQLKNEMRHINTQRIMTIVKINNYEKLPSGSNGKPNIPDTWNTTYLPFIDKTQQFLNLIAYSKPPIEHQVQNNQEEQKVQPDINVSLLDDDDNKMKRFTFGGFTKVYFPAQPDADSDQKDEIQEMVDDTFTGKAIVDKIVNGKDVFIFGYGASGAGKTAMLVYNTTTKKPGFSLELCNKIAQKLLEQNTNEKNDEKRTVSVEVSFKELYYYNNPDVQTKNNSPAFKELYYYNNPDVQTKNNSPAKTYIYNDDVSQKQFQLNEDVESKSSDDDKTDSKTHKELSEYLEYEITENRRTSPTRNNPESSRSHILCFLKFKVDNVYKGSLIIADLAGVENLFDETDCDTIYYVHKYYFEYNNGYNDIPKEKYQEKYNDFNINNRQQINISGYSEFNVINSLIESKPYININNYDKIYLKNIKSNTDYTVVELILPAFSKNVGTNVDNTIYTFTIDQYGNLKEDVKYSKYIQQITEIIKQYILDDMNKSKKDSFIQKLSNNNKFSNYPINLPNFNVQIKKENRKITRIGMSNVKIKENINYYVVNFKNTLTQLNEKFLEYNSVKDVFETNNNVQFNTNDIISDFEKKTEKITTGEFKIFLEGLKGESLKQYNKSYIETQKSNTENEEKYKKSETLFKQLSFVVNEIKTRKEEGKYINKQLENLRNEMLGCMVAKSDGSLFTAPVIHSSCLSSYCGDSSTQNQSQSKKQLSNCYMIKKEPTTYGSTSDIMKEIVKYQNQQVDFNDNNNKIITKDQLNKTFKNLEVVIFTVFNISKKDKPEEGSNHYYREPTQYINIEPLKRYIENSDGDSIKGELNKLKDLFQNNKHTSIETKSSEYKKLFTENSETYNPEKLKKIIQEINLHNAASPIGTLTFTDNMAKFGRDIICQNQCPTDTDKYQFAIKSKNDAQLKILNECKKS
jgi:hypothetical protein